MLFKWKTTVVEAALQAALPTAVINNTGAGGDHDTEELVMHLPSGGRFFVAGYTPDKTMENPAEAEVDAVTLGDGQDSRGGLTSHDPAMVRAYAELRIVLGKLLNGTDTFIANHYDELF